MISIPKELFTTPKAELDSVRPEIIDPKLGILVEMDRGIITSARSIMPIAATTGVGPCLAVTVFNRAELVGGVVHIAQDPHNYSSPSEKGLSALDQVTKIVKGQSGKLEFGLFTTLEPIQPHRDFVKTVVMTLAIIPEGEFVAWDFSPTTQKTCIALDTRTGNICGNQRPFINAAGFNPDDPGAMTKMLIGMKEPYNIKSMMSAGEAQLVRDFSNQTSPLRTTRQDRPRA